MKLLAAFMLLIIIPHRLLLHNWLSRKLLYRPQFQSVIDTNKTVMLPAGIQISVYYTGTLKRPRFMALGANNTICVADMNGNKILRPSGFLS